MSNPEQQSAEDSKLIFKIQVALFVLREFVVQQF